MKNDLPSPKAEVWALCNYPAGTGGANAFLGIARRFAESTDLELRIQDIKTIESDFKSAIERITNHLPKRLQLEPSPESRRPSWGLRDLAVKETASEFLYRSHGLPTAILSSFNSYFTSNPFYRRFPMTVSTPPELFVASGLDIMIWNSYLPEGIRGLAPHSHSHEDLKREAERFSPLLKGDGKQLIAIVAADSCVSSQAPIASLINLVETYPHARFLLTSSPRCPTESFSVFSSEFRSWLSPEQAAHIVVHDFHADDKGSNPYKASLTLADHMIILGNSESMVSERLFAGRGVYYRWGYGTEVIEKHFGTDLAQTGKIKYFPASAPLTTERFVPIDTTGMITDQLVRDYEQHRSSAPQKEANPMLEILKNRMRRAAMPVTAP